MVSLYGFRLRSQAPANDQMERKERHKISHRLLVGIVVFALLIILSISSLVSYSFYLLSNRHFNEDMLECGTIIAKILNVGKIREYAETGAADSYYQSIRGSLETIREKAVWRSAPFSSWKEIKASTSGMPESRARPTSSTTSRCSA